MSRPPSPGAGAAAAQPRARSRPDRQRPGSNGPAISGAPARLGIDGHDGAVVGLVVHPEPTPQGADSRQPAGIVAAIPARFASTRLPGKVLRQIGGRPLIEHVYRRARRARGLDAVVVLTDDPRVAEAVSAFGGDCQLTPVDCATGTDRIAHAARRWTEVTAVINVQGDEPLIDPEGISRIARHLARHPDDPMVTLAAPAGPEDLDDPNVVKVVVDRGGYALYFSRAPIPYRREPGGAAPLRHVGIYGYQIDALRRLAALERTPLERTESLEQLRALEHGLAIRVLEVEGVAPGVDTEDDLRRVERILGETRR